jgi:tetratricopeptide (TPR) repeat protein
MIEVFISVNYEEAIACYDKAREIHPNYLDACGNKGLALESLKKYEEAIA